MDHMSSLDEALNIGPKLRRALHQVGVDDLDTLTARGAISVWEDLRAAGLYDCINSLSALEGAIQGVRWRSLDAVTAATLRARVRTASSRPGGLPTT